MVAYVKKQFEDHKKSWPADAPTPIRLAEEPPVEGEKPPVKKAEPRVKHYLEKASFPYQAEFTALGKDYVAIIDDKGRGMLYVFKTPKSVSPIEITPGLVNIYGESEAIQKQGEASQAGFPKSIAEMKDLRNPKLAGYTVIKDPKKGREGDVKKVDKEVNFGSRW
ncbi:hypothetical protein BDP27DRAFT_1353268 [Rhodocollybia butyracea]|uniref:Uncharacterized protein n=1 Tax=Rhodocollybia butyracea TaxID=206335 RepID=A0A9P5TV19_9AGAR|nr:hypothetical protein BDP27DRAFT_1353268 [Rhodocollybia butyracea]